MQLPQMPPMPQLPKNLNPINPIKLADLLFKKNERVSIFLELPVEQRLDYLQSLTPRVKRELLLHIPTEELVKILESLDPDEATDILQILTRKKREEALQHISTKLKDSLSTLLEFDPETAAGLMTLDYVQVDYEDNVSTVAKKFKTHEKQTGRPPVILVMKEGKLAGFLPGHELGFAAKSERINKYVKRMPSISYAATHDEVIRLFNKHPHNKVAVLNDAEDVIG